MISKEIKLFLPNFIPVDPIYRGVAAALKAAYRGISLTVGFFAKAIKNIIGFIINVIISCCLACS